MNDFGVALVLFVVFFKERIAQVPLIPEPTRPINIWDPFRVTTTARTPGEVRRNEVLVRLSIGDLIGHKIVLPNLPWTPTQNPMEQIRQDWSHFEPNPVLPSNNVTVLTFLGVPYAEPPVSQRRFKVSTMFS